MLARLFPVLALAAPLSAQDGMQLYTIYCSACHGPDGKGATGGTFPPLAGSPWVAGEPDRMVKIILKGLTGPVDVLGTTYNLEMPPQGAVLPDDQVAAVATHIRSAWGNQAGPVTPEQVKAIRAEVAERREPWTAAELLKAHPLPLEKTALTNLISQAYSGEWSALPDFATLEAANVEEEHDGILSLQDSPFEDHFAMLWQGDFEAPADGEYRFLLDADDAAAIRIDGKTVAEIKGAGPMNGSRARQGKITLTKGPHRFRAELVEFTDKQGIAVGWRGPGDKGWKWLSDTSSTPGSQRPPIPIRPENGRPVIYRNFIEGTTPRAIGVGFPGGVNLAYSADHLAPELLWTGEFIDGGPKWIERGTDSNPPAGENVVRPTRSRHLPAAARFKGYKLDADGNPTFIVQLDSGFLHDAWRAETDALVRRLTLSSEAAPVELPVADQPLPDFMELAAAGGQLVQRDGTSSLALQPGQSITLTYRWK